MAKMVLLSGFLGAGKTTLLQRILDYSSQKKVGVLVNEFGAINIDGKLLDRDGISLSEVSNGSIFCACVKDKFVDALIEMSSQDIEYLFIEASGLADPANMPDILAGIKHELKTDYALLGSICVVDAERFIELTNLLTAIISQVQFSSVILINKIDRIKSKTECEIERRITELNPEVMVYKTIHCGIDVGEVLSYMENDSFERASEETSNTYESRPKEFGLKVKDGMKESDLRAFLNGIAKDTYRIKGIVNLEGKKRLVSCVGESVDITDIGEDQPVTGLVVISAVGIRLISSITEQTVKLGLSEWLSI